MKSGVAAFFLRAMNFRRLFRLSDLSALQGGNGLELDHEPHHRGYPLVTTGFSRTLRTLRADGFGWPAAGIAVAVCFAMAWAGWCSLAQVTLYEVTGSARLEVDRAITPVQSPIAGRVVTAYLTMGREVKAGDILLELDTHSEQLQILEERAKLAALQPQLQALREQAVAEEQARGQEQVAGRAAAEEAKATARQAEAPARFAESDAQRLTQLRASGLIPEREYQRGKAGALQLQAAADSQRLAIQRIEQEQRTRGSDRVARLKSLAADMTRIEAQIPALQVSIQRLGYEIERRRVRAPVAGRLGEAAILRPGAVVHEGEKLGAIVPDGRLAVVAQFAPPAALGRIHAGQPARLRLQGFPWMQYGTVRATVTRVAEEVRDGSVRVELAVDRQAPSAIPLQHGLPGAVEVEVDRVTPAALILRNAGRMLSAPRNAYLQSALEGNR
jgi:multidrug resistance efflux pump